METERKAEEGDKSKERLESEFGDLLFSVINAARLYGVDPENALERTNRKFISRFNHIERRLREMGKSFDSVTLEEMDALWNEAKTGSESLNSADV